MARKSKAQIEAEKEAEFQAREAEIEKRTEERFSKLLPGIIAATMAQMGSLRAADGNPLAVDATAYDGLAHAIAKAADPGNTRQIVPPEQMRRRQEGRKAMMDLISSYHERNVAGDAEAMPVYQVIRQVVFAETLIEPQYHDPVSKKMMHQEINWPGIPNHGLLPLNEPARAIHAQFLEWVGDPPLAVRGTKAPWVLSANKIMRGRDMPEAPMAPVGLPLDPRRHQPGDAPKRQAVLGTLHTPAVVGP